MIDVSQSLDGLAKCAIGIGNKDILSKQGIDTLVDLPGVGENLRETMNSGFAFHELTYVQLRSRLLRGNVDPCSNEMHS